MGKITFEIVVRVVGVIANVISVLNDTLKGDKKDDSTRGSETK
jgi:hypothetical protein